MIKGICQLSYIPMRAQPTEKSEMVSQLLFGETYTILDKNDKWVLVLSDFDQYEGWISLSQIFELAIDQTNSSLSKLVNSKTLTVKTKAWGEQLISLGSILHPLLLEETLNGIELNIVEAKPETQPLDFAQLLLGVPYLWGGRSAFGLDCSGFTQLIWKAAGIQLPRDARQQVQMGQTVSFIQEALPNDLVFFENEEGLIIHTGILIDSQTVIHASGFVRIDSIDHHGIFDQKSKRYTHKLRIIKRI